MNQESDASDKADRRHIEDALTSGDIRQVAQATTDNFFGPIRTIIPWATNHYTETLIDGVRQKFGADFWGFLMLGGMSGGGLAGASSATGSGGVSVAAAVAGKNLSST